MKKLFPLVALLLILSCNNSQPTEEPTPEIKRPKNVILLVGDGMGLSQVSASVYFKDAPSNFEQFPVIGLSKTSASAQLITDSAAGATAFASGIKTYNGAVGVAPDSTHVATIPELLQDRGYVSGVVATSSITHATPACFYAHVPARGMYEKIAEQLTYSNMQFFAGGGIDYFARRSDSVNLIETLKTKGFSVDTTSMPSQATAGRMAILLGADAIVPQGDGGQSFLQEASMLAIENLSQNQDGFFLMIEGSQIDWGGHSNNADYLISELLDFDKTIGLVLEYAKKNPETLVVVTADHETGGFTLSSDDSDYNKIAPSFSTDGHSGTMVPVFAFGPGAESFGGMYENTEIFHRIMKALATE
ncbi:MAG: alkaline phosphatase [Gilvibacter sp.]